MRLGVTRRSWCPTSCRSGSPAARRAPVVPARPTAPAVHAVQPDVAGLHRRPHRHGALLGARGRPDPAEGPEAAVLLRRRRPGDRRDTTLVSLRRRVAPLLAALTVVAAGAVTGCSSDVGSSGDQGYVAGKGIITSLAVGDRHRPGPVSGTTLD